MPPSSARSKRGKTNVEKASQVTAKKARTPSASSRLDEAEQVSHASLLSFFARCTRCTLLFCTIPPSWRQMRRDRVCCLITQAVGTSTPCSEASCSRLDSPEQVSHGSFSEFSARCTRSTLLFRTFSLSWRRMRRDRVSRLITQVDSTSTPRSDASCSRLDGAQQVSHGSFFACFVRCTRCTLSFCTVLPSWCRMGRDRVLSDFRM